MKTMNKSLPSFVLLLALQVSSIGAQDINWSDVSEGKKHFVTLNFGADYSTYYGLQYGYRIGNTKLPLILDAEFTVPFGEDVFDDWNARMGIQSKLWSHNHVWWSVGASVITRKFVSDVASIMNFGSSLSTLLGYQKPKWGIAAEFSYERSEVSKIEHHLLSEYYPEITDGWYDTSGGNFKMGVQAQANIKSINLFVHIGKSFGQDFQDNPTLPYYAKLGINKSF